MRYAHTNIIARDWRTLAEFYIAVFRCSVNPPERRQSGEWLEDGTGVPDAALEGVHLVLPGFGETGPELEIYSYSEMIDQRPGPANRTGLGHLAFEVDDVEEVVRDVLRHGGRMEGAITTRLVEGVGTITFVYVRDPEGNLVEVQAWDEPG